MAKKKKESKQNIAQKAIRSLATAISRRSLGALLGSSHDTKRDIYKAVGYKKNLTFDDYLVQYQRQDIAARVVDAPAQATWRRDPEILEDDDETSDTQFEQDIKKLARNKKMYKWLERIDRLSGIGEFGVLFLGINDGGNPEDPVNVDEMKSIDDILYFAVYTGSEDESSSARIDSLIDDPSDPRFNLPEFYRIEIRQGKTEDDTKSVKVHWSRVIHVAEGLLEDEVNGEPRLKKVFNRLKDLEKVIAGAAEFYWINSRMGLHVDVGDDFAMGDLSGNIDDVMSDLQDEFDEYFHGTRRVMRTRGVDIENIGSTVSDPTPIIEMELQFISAKTGIPRRILVGSERGELASTQDEANWNKKVEERQTQHAEPNILRALIDRFLEWGILKLKDEESGYKVKWPDLFALNDIEKAELAKTITESVKNYVTSVGMVDIQQILGIDEFREVLGLEPRTLEEIAEQIVRVVQETGQDLDEASVQVIEQFKRTKAG